MKARANLVLKSLADLPTNVLTLAVAIPGRTMQLSKSLIAAPARATRRHIRTARHHSAEVFRDIYRHAHTPMQIIHPWLHGGLNE